MREPLSKATRHVPEIAHLPASTLRALFEPERDIDVYASLVRSIEHLFAFDQAIVLEDVGDCWNCAAAFPSELRDVRWPHGPLSDELAAGPVPARRGHADLQACN